MEFKQDSWSEGKNQIPQSGALPNIAPPPVEISVRTMASDVASMTETGGGPPRAQSIVIPSLQAQVSQAQTGETRPGSLSISAQTGEPESFESFKPRSSVPRLLMIFVPAAIGVGALFFVGYAFLFPLLGPQKPPPAIPPAPTSTAPTPPPAPKFEHQSFFRKPVDGAFALKIFSPIAGLQTESQQLKAFLAAAADSTASASSGQTGLPAAGSTSSPATASFFEVAMRNGDDAPLSANDFFSLISAPILNPDFLVSNFNPDFTVFLYRSNGIPLAQPASSAKQNAKQGIKQNAPSPQAVPESISAGYILQLNGNQSPLLLRSDTAVIERASSSWANLFVDPAGAPVGQFRDSLVNGQPIRMLQLSNASSVFAYGWFFNKYLIISTSLEGMKQAIQRF